MLLCCVVIAIKLRQSDFVARASKALILCRHAKSLIAEPLQLRRKETGIWPKMQIAGENRFDCSCRYAEVGNCEIGIGVRFPESRKERHDSGAVNNHVDDI